MKKKLPGLLLAAALLLTPGAALARDRYHGYEHRHHDHFSLRFGIGPGPHYYGGWGYPYRYYGYGYYDRWGRWHSY